jgi:hypothetical protein
MNFDKMYSQFSQWILIEYRVNLTNEFWQDVQTVLQQNSALNYTLKIKINNCGFSTKLL